MEKVVARVNERTPTGHIYSPKCFEPYKGKHLPVFKPGAEGYPDRNAFPLGLATITRIEGNEVFADFNLTVEGQELLKLYRPGAAGLGTVDDKGVVATYELEGFFLAPK